MKSMIKALMFFCVVFFAADVNAGEVSWFTDTPPMKEMMKKLRHAHGGHVEMGRGGLHIKSLWLRSGTHPGDGEPVHHRHHPGNGSAEVLLRYPDGKVTEIKPVENGHAYGFRFEMPQEGFYNMYHLERFVDDGVLERPDIYLPKTSPITVIDPRFQV